MIDLYIFTYEKLVNIWWTKANYYVLVTALTVMLYLAKEAYIVLVLFKYFFPKGNKIMTNNEYIKLYSGHFGNNDGKYISYQIWLF